MAGRIVPGRAVLVKPFAALPWDACHARPADYSAKTMDNVPARTGSVHRNTTETRIAITVDLDGTGAYQVSTGIGFLDHMVEQFSRHSLIDVSMTVEGDLHVDQHHTTEDSAIALGQAIGQALGDKAGIGRYGAAYSPMDETLSRVALDISGRPFLVWKAKFTQERLGEWDTELIEHWFHSVSQAAGITLHMELLYGSNNHHICESLYDAAGGRARPAQGRGDPVDQGAVGWLASLSPR
jgi:imidazoleglycerol-phosphate dehydratase